MKTDIYLICSIFLAFSLVLSLVSVSALTISSVTSSPAEVAPGQKVGLNLNVDNNFDSVISDITIKLNLENLPISPYGEGVEKTIDKINEDKGKEVEFEVFVSSDAKSQTYKIPVLITYKNDNQMITKNDFISLSVKAKPEIGVSSSDLLIKGQEKTVIVKIVNSGLENVKFLKIKILSPAGVRLLSSQEEYIGDLNSDDSDSAEFRMFVNKEAGSVIKLPVEVNYKDSTTKEHTENFDIGLKAYSEKEGIELGLIKKSNSGVYFGVIVLFVLLFIFYRVMKRKRRKE